MNDKFSILSKFNVIEVVGLENYTGPEGLDLDRHVILNASRPIPGTAVPYPDTLEWQGDFVHGVFYAAVSLDDPGFADIMQLDLDLDGHIINYIPLADHIARVERYRRELMEQHPDANLDTQPFSEIEHLYYVRAERDGRPRFVNMGGRD